MKYTNTSGPTVGPVHTGLTTRGLYRGLGAKEKGRIMGGGANRWHNFLQKGLRMRSSRAERGGEEYEKSLTESFQGKKRGGGKKKKGEQRGETAESCVKRAGMG